MNCENQRNGVLVFKPGPEAPVMVARCPADLAEAGPEVIRKTWGSPFGHPDFDTRPIKPVKPGPFIGEVV